jgi:hypothetical protein
MMERKKAILLQALCGAVVGALGVRFGSRVVELSPAFSVDKLSLAQRQYLVAAIPWVWFSLYWEFAAKNATAAKSAEAKVSRAFHVFLANVAIVLEIAPIRGWGRFLPVSYGIMAAGFAVEMAGLILAIWSRRALGRNWSREIAVKVEDQLIRSGPSISGCDIPFIRAF